MDTSEHDMVLGMPWLMDSNPLINWKTGQLWWEEEEDPADSSDEELTPDKEEIGSDSEDIAENESLAPEKSQREQPLYKLKQWRILKAA